MKLKEIQMYNRAPFDNLHLLMNNSNITVLSGVNGAGKTTILSYIVDALYEFAKEGYPNSFKGIENKFYRISSETYTIEPRKLSFVYLRFENDGNNIDYIDVRYFSEDEYKKAIQVEDAMPYSKLKNYVTSDAILKYFNTSGQNEAKKYFEKNILTYFPAYRYEQPGYLTAPYEVSLSFKLKGEFSGNLINPVEVTTSLPEIANWIMDIVLDSEIYDGQTEKVTITQLNKIFTILLQSKIKKQVRLGIGPRRNGMTRIQIVDPDTGKTVYPSIFNMSSGELALICLFCEISRQADRIGKTIDEVEGIVLIDEIDKHLHIKIQKDVLPVLIKMFPNIQFISTSHSPFLNLGFADEKDDFYKIYDMDNEGISCRPQNSQVFKEVYNMLIDENNQFAQKYKQLVETVKESTKPLIITEGKTDWKHLKAAMKALDIKNLNVEFYEYSENMGDNTLMELLKNFSITSPNRKIIGVFDRDNEKILDKTVKSGEPYVELSKNIFAFSIPTANEEIYGTHTSIEHYYKKDHLLKPDNKGRRLFLGEEFYASGLSKNGIYQTKAKGIQNKVEINGIIDEKVYAFQQDPCFNASVALSKDDFAQMILDESEYAKDFDFTEFNKIFNVIDEIVNV